jgi:hypothetical protein
MGEGRESGFLWCWKGKKKKRGEKKKRKKEKSLENLHCSH